jgi:hypothetical protein
LRQIHFAVALAALSVLACVCAGCGGGGGGSAGSGIAITGTVTDVVVGIPSPVAEVQAGATAQTTTSTVDGSFSLTVPSGTTKLVVIWESSTGGSPVSFTFTIPPVTAAEDVGELWIGPAQVTASGTAIDSTTQAPIGGATVTLGGVTGTTASNGTFTVGGVAYAASSQFPNLPGTISAPNYISAGFEPGTAAVTNGALSVGEIELTPSSSTIPPGTPYNLWGRVSPLKSSPGATVTLSLNGTPYRTATVGSDGTYYFWVPAGTYTINVVQTGFTAPTITATLTSTNQKLEEDVTLTGT